MEGGNKISSNTETSGRFHTDWLNMMQPRIRLARNLLRDDGALFISIDSGEVANLRLVCDEVFGEESFVMDLIWRKRDGAPNDRTIGSVHEHILVYGKALSSTTSRTQAEERLNLMPRTEKADSQYRVFTEPDGPDSRGAFRKIDTTANAKGGRDVPKVSSASTVPSLRCDESLYSGSRVPTSGHLLETFTGGDGTTPAGGTSVLGHKGHCNDAYA